MQQDLLCRKVTRGIIQVEARVSYDDILVFLEDLADAPVNEEDITDILYDVDGLPPGTAVHYEAGTLGAFAIEFTDPAGVAVAKERALSRACAALEKAWRSLAVIANCRAA